MSMSILKIARMGHPVLRTKARALDKPEIRSAAMQKLIDDMIETMHEYHGVGLAAPQIHESVRLFVAALDHARRTMVMLKATRPSRVRSDRDHQSRDYGGRERRCRGLGRLPQHPRHRGRVPRAREIKVRGYDRKGDRLELRAQGFAARVIQHETDHLDGVLFFDRMNAFDSLTFLDEYSRYWVKD